MNPAIGALVTGATCIALSPIFVRVSEAGPTATAFWRVALAGLALVSHAAGQGLIAYALAHLPAGFSSVSLLLQPVMAAAFAWILLAEPLGRLQMIGGGIVLLGIYLARRGSM